jgi:DNA-binding transcriptional LysR family regulator
MGDRGFALRSNDLTNLLTAARAGLGLAVLPCSMARTEPDLVHVPTPLPPLTRELWLVFHRDVGRSPAVRAVINRIISIVASAKDAFLGDPAANGARLAPRVHSATRPRETP